jgi:hypothetical protein
MSIILLRGFSHSGKDFVGQILCNDFGYKRFAFADSLKKMVQIEFKCSWEQLHTQAGKQEICENDSLKRTYRQILIDEALRLRNMDPDIFANDCCIQIDTQDPKNVPDKIVITDWRYPNEIKIIKESFPNHAIIPVHIIREGQTKSPVDDISENHLINRINDYTIINRNNNTIYDEIDILLKYISNIK